MLQIFRKFFKSSGGVFAALGLIILLAMAFAASDVAQLTNSVGLGDGDRVASVDGNKISTAQVVKQSQQALEIARNSAPDLTMKTFVAEGGLGQVVDQMIDAEAMIAFGKQQGVVAGKRLIDSELAKIPAFQGAGGKFDDATYRSLLAQRQLTDAEVRESFARDLVGRQLLAPVQLGASVPTAALLHYASLLTEQRVGTISLLPSQAFAPKGEASAAEITAWYNSHKQAYAIPERRVLRFARFDETAVKNTPAPTDAEITAKFNADKAQYAASESRKVTQLIVISESMAKDIAQAIAEGQTLEAAAKAKGLSAASLGVVTKDKLAMGSGPAVAQAAFAAAKGSVAGPVKGALGWALLRVDAIETKPARTLEQVKDEIIATLTISKRKAALAALTEKISEDFDKSGALSDTAKELGLTLSETPALTADGQVFGQAGQSITPDLAGVVKAAFGMEHEAQPQITELVAGKSFVIFDVSRSEAATTAPLDSVKAQVIRDIALNKGADAAKAAAMKLLAAGKKGADLAPQVAALGVALPPVQPVSISRQQIAAMGGRIPPAISLFFSMAKGTTKLLPILGNKGWFVVQLKAINTTQLDAQHPLIGQVAGELKQLAAREQGEALRRAIRAQIKVDRNDKALQTIAAQLNGAN